MNATLTKYLSGVLRNEVERSVDLETKESNLQVKPYLLDRNINQFVVDKRFSLRLDDVI